MSWLSKHQILGYALGTTMQTSTQVWSESIQQYDSISTLYLKKVFTYKDIVNTLDIDRAAAHIRGIIVLISNWTAAQMWTINVFRCVATNTNCIGIHGCLIG